MRHGTSNRRSRNNRNNNNNNRGKGGGSNRAQVFDSNGPEVRIRGTAFQIFEKYETLAKDARSSGDTVLAESYSQHAEHYQRIISTWDEQDAERNAQNAEREERQDTYSKAEPKDVNRKAHNDDLGLPASILGGEVKVASQASSRGARQSQSVMEDA